MASDPKRKDKSLKERLVADRLKDVSNLVNKQKDHAGLTSSFKEGIQQANEASMALCERAMEDLSTVYVNALTAFRETSDPLHALSNLEKSEEVWRKGAEIIRRYDADGGEDLFLKKMRAMAAEVLEKKLNVVENSATSLSPQHEALCLGILGVMDYMFIELGYTETSEERKYIREKVKRFS